MNITIDIGPVLVLMLMAFMFVWIFKKTGGKI